MAAQKRSRKLSLARFRSAFAVGKIEIPSGLDEMTNPWHEPFPVLRSEPEIEDPERQFSMARPDRQHRIAQQRKVTTIRAAGDQEPGGRHRGPTTRRGTTLPRRLPTRRQFSDRGGHRDPTTSRAPPLPRRLPTRR